jgi:hypothetical protein
MAMQNISISVQIDATRRYFAREPGSSAGTSEGFADHHWVTYVDVERNAMSKERDDAISQKGRADASERRNSPPHGMIEHGFASSERRQELDRENAVYREARNDKLSEIRDSKKK